MFYGSTEKVANKSINGGVGRLVSLTPTMISHRNEFYKQDNADNDKVVFIYLFLFTFGRLPGHVETTQCLNQ